MRKAEWEELVREQERSGETVAAYCRARGISKSSFKYWKSKAEQGERGKFVQVGAGSSHLEIELRSGVRASLPLSASGEEIRKLLEAIDAISR